MYHGPVLDLFGVAARVSGSIAAMHAMMAGQKNSWPEEFWQKISTRKS
jgi:hypothetical protein